MDDGEPRRGGGFQDADRAQFCVAVNKQALQYKKEDSAVENEEPESRTHLICKYSTCQKEGDFCLQRKKSAACFRSTPSAAGVSFLEIDLY